MRQLAAIDNFFVIAEMWDISAQLVGGIHHHAAFLHFHFLAVYFNFNHDYAFSL